MPLIPPIARLEPPANDAPIADDGQHSEAWATYHQSIADRVTNLPEVALAAARKGVVDGSNAAAGDIGEYVTSTFGVAALTNNIAANVGSISLPAGDWDVSGYVLFTSSANNLVGAQAWVGTVSATSTDPRSVMLLFAGQMGGGTRLVAPSIRVNSASPTTVYLGALASFAAGTAGGQGTIWARRAR